MEPEPTEPEAPAEPPSFEQLGDPEVAGRLNLSRDQKDEIAELLEELRELASQASDNGRPLRRNRFHGGWGGGFF